MQRVKPREDRRVAEIRNAANVAAATHLKARYRIKALWAGPLILLSVIVGIAALAPLLAINIWPPLYIAAACATGSIAFLFCLAAALSARSYAGRIRLVDQRIRDIRAGELYLNLKAGEEVERYSVYLRPFKSTNDLRMSDPREAARWEAARSLLSALGGAGGGGAPILWGLPASPATLSADATHLEFEGAVMASLATRAPLVCLGHGLEHIGAGRIEVPDEEWQDGVARLVASADLIIICPSKQPGTLWELEHLAAGGFIDRTVFVDMPESGYRGGRWTQRNEWGPIAAMLGKHGYELPKETESGLFMYFGAQKSPLMATGIGRLEISRLGRFFDAVMNERRKRQQGAEAIAERGP